MADYEDPGWRAPLRDVGWLVLPFAHLWMLRQRRGDVGLLSLRRIYLGFVGSLLLFIIAFSFVEPWNGVTRDGSRSQSWHSTPPPSRA